MSILNNHYRTNNVFYDDGKYNKKIIKNEMSNIRRNFRFIYIFMLPLKLLLKIKNNILY
ncbi:hypothetical protein HMPREF0774_2816 [Staphylococcus aureus subsp. aureus TCH130]|nr:hypothetical protein HMPREF0774_2816 [Staphylococcus aureus subsp. aureus TCH130]